MTICEGPCRILRGAAAWIQSMTNTQNPIMEQLVSLSTAAARLNISLRSLYRLMAQRQLPLPLKVGRSSKLSEIDLSNYLQTLKSKRP